jgi:hypothetical protein
MGRISRERKKETQHGGTVDTESSRFRTMRGNVILHIVICKFQIAWQAINDLWDRVFLSGN